MLKVFAALVAAAMTVGVVPANAVAQRGTPKPPPPHNAADPNHKDHKIVTH